MRYRKTAIAVAVAVASLGAWWIGGDDIASITNALGGKPAQTVAKAKAICAFPVSPDMAPPIDCIPQQLADLPPDPGEKGKRTIDGIITNQRGIRDDVYIEVMKDWWHSPIAQERLFIAARQMQRAVHYGDSLGKEETRKRFAAKLMQESACAIDLETQEVRDSGARNKVKLLVLNTDERRARQNAFDMMFALQSGNGFMPAFEGTPDEACGFNVAAMARAEDKQTIASKLLAESIARTQPEEQEAPK